MSTKKTKAPKSKANAVEAVSPVTTLMTGILGAAAAHAEKATLLQPLADQGDEKAKMGVKNATTHSKAMLGLHSAGDAVAAVIAQFGLSTELIDIQSREFKLRLRKVCEGIATGQRPKDNAFDAAMAYLVSRKESQSAFDYGAIQKQMNHETPTQARYMGKMLRVLNAAQKIKGGFEIDWEAPILASILPLYGDTSTPIELSEEESHEAIETAATETSSELLDADVDALINAEGNAE